MNNCDLDEYWKIKILRRNGFSPKLIKLEQNEDSDIQFNQNGHCELFMFECSIHIFRT